MDLKSIGISLHRFKSCWQRVADSFGKLHTFKNMSYSFLPCHIDSCFHLGSSLLSGSSFLQKTQLEYGPCRIGLMNPLVEDIYIKLVIKQLQVDSLLVSNTAFCYAYFVDEVRRAHSLLSPHDNFLLLRIRLKLFLFNKTLSYFEEKKSLFSCKQKFGLGYISVYYIY